MTANRLLVLVVVAAALVGYLGIVLVLRGRKANGRNSVTWRLLTADISCAALRTAAWLWMVLDPHTGPRMYDSIPAAGWFILVSQTVQTFIMWALAIWVLKG